MKSFDKYILKEIASPFGIGLLVYTFTLLINMIFILSGTLIAKEASMLTVLQILLYMLPDFLSFTIPMSTLMGILAGLSRMSTDSEIVAFRTMGVNNARILKPIMIFAILNWLFSSWLIMYMAPEAGFRLVRLLAQVQTKRTISDIKPQNFYTKLPYYTLYFNDIDQDTGEWKDVFLYSKKKGDTDQVILAKRGRFKKEIDGKDSMIYLTDAIVHSYKRKKPRETYELINYLTNKQEVPGRNTILQKRKEKWLIFPELVRRMKKAPQNINLSIEFHRKFSLPFACLALGFLALSLGISTKKGGKVSGFIISLGVIFVYYTTSITTENMVLKGILPPIVGMWAADVLLLIIGIVLFYYSSKEKTINWDKLLHIVDRAKHHFDKNKKRIERNVLVVVKLPRIRGRFRIFKIIDVYVAKKLLFSFFLIFSSLLFVFYIINIVERVDDVVENKVSFKYIFEYLYYDTPEIISFVLPVAVLTTVLLTFSMMSKNNEIVAVQVSGISLFRLTLPAVILGILLSAGFFYVQEEVTPGANKRKMEVGDIIHNRKSHSQQEILRNWVVGKDNTFYFYEYIDPKSRKISKFNIIYMGKDLTIKKRIHAESARWEGPQEIVLEKGFERDYKSSRQQNLPLTYHPFTLKTMMIEEGQELFTERRAFPEHMNIETLKSYISYLKEKKSDTRKYEAQLQYKYAFPLSSLIMVLIAIPFSFIMGNKGTLFGIGIAIGTSMIFWFASAVFSALGTAGILTPFISAFAPIFIFTLISFYLFINIKT